ncbi:MAG: hypothetical protein K6A34_06985 [Methanobrevibacter sp.]|nr:hypothetical protein [Methanobrevibacter sp.]
MNGTGKKKNNKIINNHYFDKQGLKLPVTKKLSKRERRYYNSLREGLDNLIKHSQNWIGSYEYTQLKKIARNTTKAEPPINSRYRHSKELKEFFDSSDFKDELNNLIDENVESSSTFIEEFYMIGARLGYKQLRKGMNLSPADAEALYIIQQYNFDLIRNLNTELCVGIRETIFNAVATGQSTQTTKKQLLELPLEPIGNVSVSRRAEMIARTEHARAVNTGTLQAYENYNVGEVEIITAGDDDVCDDCLDLESNNPYTLNEAQDLLPVHPNCFMPDTLIATQYGWKHFQDLNREDTILSFNPKDNSIDFLPYVQLIGHYNIFKYMYHIYNDDIDMCITPDHNCFVYQNGEPCFMKPWELNKDSEFLISYDNLYEKEFVNFNDCYVEKIEYTGMVYCVELPKYHTLWVKRNNKVSWNGNCRCSYGPVASSLTLNPNPEPVDLTIESPEDIAF